MGDQRQVVR